MDGLEDMVDQLVLMVGSLMAAIRGWNSVSVEVYWNVYFVFEVEISVGFVSIKAFHFCPLGEVAKSLNLPVVIRQSL